MDVPVFAHAGGIICAVLRCSIFKRADAGVRLPVRPALGIYQRHDIPDCTGKKLPKSGSLSDM